MIADIDKDGSGTIDYEEFLQVQLRGERGKRRKEGEEGVKISKSSCIPY